MESCFPLLKKFSPRSHYNGTCSKTCHDEEKESVNTKDFTNGNSSIPSISATIVPSKEKEEAEDEFVEDNDLHKIHDGYILDKSEINGKIKYFPKMFVTVIYIVILFVSFGTIFVQLIIFAKGALTYEYGQGIWCGAIFCVCGILGVTSSMSPSVLKVKLFLASNLAAIVVALTLAFLSSLNIDRLRYSLANITLKGHPYSTFSDEAGIIRINVMLLVVHMVISLVVLFLISFSLVGMVLLTFVRNKMIARNQAKKGVVWV